jgi:hypothetical protein
VIDDSPHIDFLNASDIDGGLVVSFANLSAAITFREWIPETHVFWNTTALYDGGVVSELSPRDRRLIIFH